MSDTIAEVVPDVAKVGGRLAQSSIITGRRRVRLVPQSGQNYGSGASSGIINILVADGQAYADLLSACLSFEITTHSGSNLAAAPAVGTFSTVDDGAYSVFRRCLISVNSTLMDDTDMIAKKVNAELYATASQAWYDNVGSWMGLWARNTAFGGYVGSELSTGIMNTAAENNVSKYNVLTKAIKNAAFQQSAGAVGSAPSTPGRNKYMIPLSLITSFFRNDTLFPSRNAGQLYIQLNLASAVEALIQGLTGTPTFNITNLTCELDFVDLHPTYLSLMDDLIESPSGAGVNWAFDSHLVSTQNLNATATTVAAGSASQQSVIVSKASQNIRSLQIVAQPSAGLTNVKFPSQSCFSNPQVVDVQYRVGSLYYPAFVAVGEHRQFADLQNAFGSPESIDKSGIIDNFNYYQTTSSLLAEPAAAQGTVQSNNNGVGVATSVLNLNGNAWGCDTWTYAYCFDRLKHAKFHGVDLDGLNSLTSAGSQMVVQINCNPLQINQSPGGAAATGGTTLVSIVRFTRVLHLGGGATSVIG